MAGFTRSKNRFCLPNIYTYILLGYHSYLWGKIECCICEQAYQNSVCEIFTTGRACLCTYPAPSYWYFQSCSMVPNLEVTGEFIVVFATHHHHLSQVPSAEWRVSTAKVSLGSTAFRALKQLYPSMLVTYSDFPGLFFWLKRWSRLRLWTEWLQHLPATRAICYLFMRGIFPTQLKTHTSLTVETVACGLPTTVLAQYCQQSFRQTFFASGS